jgi:hypothetical protein
VWSEQSPGLGSVMDATNDDEKNSRIPCDVQEPPSTLPEPPEHDQVCVQLTSPFCEVESFASTGISFPVNETVGVVWIVARGLFQHHRPQPHYPSHPPAAAREADGSRLGRQRRAPALGRNARAEGGLHAGESGGPEGEGRVQSSCRRGDHHRGRRRGERGGPCKRTERGRCNGMCSRGEPGQRWSGEWWRGCERCCLWRGRRHRRGCLRCSETIRAQRTGGAPRRSGLRALGPCGQ